MGKKLTDEEIQKVKDLTNSTEKFAVELGAKKIKKIALRNRKIAVIDHVNKLNIERVSVFKDLEVKYGSGQLNVDTWEVDS